MKVAGWKHVEIMFFSAIPTILITEPLSFSIGRRCVHVSIRLYSMTVSGPNYKDKRQVCF